MILDNTLHRPPVHAPAHPCNSIRYFFHIGFSGIHYRGWQIQEGALNVQGVIEHALSQVLKEKITIMGCGRTDAKVHASQFFFHTDITKEWDYDLLFRINKILPADIAVFDIIRMPANAHARFDASQRTYDYFIHTRKDPFLSTVSSLYQIVPLNITEMKKAVSMLPLYEDYRSFCTTPSRHRTTICKVSCASLWVDPAGERIRFQISANRFLSSMIRIIVGNLLAIGTNAMSLDEFEGHLARPSVQKALEPAYPQGLFLSSVKYPYLNLASRMDFSAMSQNNYSLWQEI
jgi:tRNA pseudouridine38-40 synthase